jgi:hypothetical protein
MDISSLQEIQHNDLVRKRLAKLLALECFRNARELEDLHAGMHPSSDAGDFSDVKVVSPYGEIPWSKLSRLSPTAGRGQTLEVLRRRPMSVVGGESCHTGNTAQPTRLTHSRLAAKKR